MRPRLRTSFPAGLVLAVVLAWIPGCSPGMSGRFEAMEVGMSEADVRGLLGPPSVTVPGEPEAEGRPATGPRWQYGDNLSTMATAAAFPRTVPARVWVVWFDPEGRVISWRRPERAWGIDGGENGSAPSTPLFRDPLPPRSR